MKNYEWDSEFLTKIIDQICDYAVDHNYNPDETLITIAENILELTEIATFKEWKKGE